MSRAVKTVEIKDVEKFRELVTSLSGENLGEVSTRIASRNYLYQCVSLRSINANKLDHLCLVLGIERDKFLSMICPPDVEDVSVVEEVKDVDDANTRLYERLGAILDAQNRQNELLSRMISIFERVWC